MKNNKMNSNYLLTFNGDWGLGIGDWGLGIGPNPQSPIPNLKILYMNLIINFNQF